MSAPRMPPKSFTAHHRPLRGVGDHMITQLEFARAGIITKEMIYVAYAREPRP